MEGRFSEVKLPAHVIASLYSEDLVLVSGETAAPVKNVPAMVAAPVSVPQNPPVPVAEPLGWLGGNEKKVTVLVHETGVRHLNDADLAQLVKILTACKLSLADIAIVNHARHAVNYKQLAGDLQPRYVLLFGVSPAAIELPFTIPLYQVQRHGSTAFIHSVALDVLATDTVAKKSLWDGLKKLFGIG